MMKKTTAIIISITIGAALISCGDEENIVEVPADYDCAPSPPQEVYSDNRDGYIIIWWAPNPESDISYYNILRSDSLYGDYTVIGDVEVGTGPVPYEYSFEYGTPGNGDQYYYGVTAVDDNGNESILSFVVTATPRHEGYLRLYESTADADSSGIDLTGLSGVPLPWDDLNTDIYLYDDGTAQRFVTADSTINIQDYGYVPGFDFINRAPEEGWAPSGTAEVVVSHCYLVQILSPSGGANYGKLYVVSREESYAELWWAYQDREDIRDLSPSPEYFDHERKNTGELSPYSDCAEFSDNRSIISSPKR